MQLDSYATRALFVAGSTGASPAHAALRFREFPVPSGGYPRQITTGPDGNLWFTEYVGNKIGRITPAGVITEFPVPTLGGWLQGITAGSDGNLWFTEIDANKIGRITIEGAVTEYSTPTANSGPEDITAGPDGNLWFTEIGRNRESRTHDSNPVTRLACVFQVVLS